MEECEGVRGERKEWVLVGEESGASSSEGRGCQLLAFAGLLLVVLVLI